MAFKLTNAVCSKCGKRTVKNDTETEVLCFDCHTEQEKKSRIDRDAEQFLNDRKKGD